MEPVNLDDISNGSLCVMDTNVLLYAEQGVSVQSKRPLRRMSTGELSGLLPQPAWLELSSGTWRQMWHFDSTHPDQDTTAPCDTLIAKGRGVPRPRGILLPQSRFQVVEYRKSSVESGQ